MPRNQRVDGHEEGQVPKWRTNCARSSAFQEEKLALTIRKDRTQNGYGKTDADGLDGNGEACPQGVPWEQVPWYPPVYGATRIDDNNATDQYESYPLIKQHVRNPEVESFSSLVYRVHADDRLAPASISCGDPKTVWAGRPRSNPRCDTRFVPDQVHFGRSLLYVLLLSLCSSSFFIAATSSDLP
ncbi:hypothetical protein PAXINDRAFT_12930 [Paxillus involutus ATCC 200175]|uniref:Uncharacterized protein n=1 Tax=Paxillus involutus ATCC 200175 TaxID=664439 RepID=A0A0C9SX77_PAXIN|nr:hypothetical protein PAXINDRAFT_12930 [Paxillus involutus ATCC 200175]